MKLTFKVNNCVTIFTSFNFYKRTEVSFEVKPKLFTITNLNGLTITENSDSKEDGKQINLVIVAEEFDEKIHGALDSVDGYGVSVALSCTQAQMSELNNFIVHGMHPTEIEIYINDINLIGRNFKMDKDRYIIESWKFKI
jgi:hypothetical protein